MPRSVAVGRLSLVFEYRRFWFGVELLFVRSMPREAV